jgi:hypothetical protein
MVKKMKTKKDAKDPKDYQTSGDFRTGDLIVVVKAPDQNRVIIGPLVDKIGIVQKRLGREDGVFSTVNTYSVFLDVGTVHLHSLDMRLLSRVE